MKPMPQSFELSAALRGATWVAVVASLLTWQAAPRAAPLPAKALPGDSVYQLDVPLSDQAGHAAHLADWRGKPVLITMFYTSCQFVCPRIIETMKHTEQALPGAWRGKVPALLVTFDPARDDIATLRETAVARGLDAPTWTLARTDARNVRKLAAALGIQYRELPGGDFNHTSAVFLLDADGRIAAKTFTLGAADPAFVQRVRKTLREAEVNVNAKANAKASANAKAAAQAMAKAQ